MIVTFMWTFVSSSNKSTRHLADGEVHQGVAVDPDNPVPSPEPAVPVTNQRSAPAPLLTNPSSPGHHAARVDVGDGEALGLAAAGAARDDHSQALLARLEHSQLLDREIPLKTR